MKLVFKIIFGGLFLTVFLLIFHLKSVTVRPLNITVIDGDTEEPIPNISIFHQIMTAGPGRRWMVIPWLGPTEFRFTEANQYRTDKQGVLTIPRKRYQVELYQRLYKELLEVNLRIVNSDKNQNPILYYLMTEDLVNEVSEYTSAEITSTLEENPQKFTKKTISGNNLNLKLLHYPGSLDREKESIVVKLYKIQK